MRPAPSARTDTPERPRRESNALMDLEREQERQTYRLCRLGFAILSFALVVACLTTILILPRLFGGRGVPALAAELGVVDWVDAPVVWGSLVGTYLLWGRWDNPSWQRRSGLLVVMGVVDVVLWLLEHGGDLGLRTERSATSGSATTSARRWAGPSSR